VAQDAAALQALFLVTHFAPESRASANRITRFVSLLPDEGIQPLVLTLREACTSPNDPAGLTGLPADLRVVRLPCLNPVIHVARRLPAGPSPQDRLLRFGGRVLTQGTARVLFPDALVTWAAAALPVALRLVQRERVDVLVASLPHYSTALLAAAVSRISRIPYVIDYRDAWTPSLATLRPSRPRLAAHAALERLLAGRAAGLGAVSAPHARLIEDFLGPAYRGRIAVVPNAADLHLTTDVLPYPEERFVIAHLGNLVGGRTLEPLLLALASLQREGLLHPDRFALIHYGQHHPATFATAARLGLGALVQYGGHLPRGELLRRAKGSRLTVAVQEESFAYGLPSKVLESVALGRPVLGISPPGSVMAATIAELGMGVNFDFPEHAAIARWLRLVLIGELLLPTAPRPGSLEPYTARSTTHRFAELLRAAAAFPRDAMAPATISG
jgi:hypothetical protein